MKTAKNAAPRFSAAIKDEPTAEKFGTTSNEAAEKRAKMEKRVRSAVVAARVSAEAKALAPKGKKASKAPAVDAKSEKVVKAPAGKRTMDHAKKITLLVKENPRREGTTCFKKFAQYRNGMTVGEYLAAGEKLGTTMGSVRHDVEHGFISIK